MIVKCLTAHVYAVAKWYFIYTVYLRLRSNEYSATEEPWQWERPLLLQVSFVKSTANLTINIKTWCEGNDLFKFFVVTKSRSLFIFVQKNDKAIYEILVKLLFSLSKRKTSKCWYFCKLQLYCGKPPNISTNLRKMQVCTWKKHFFFVIS